MIGIPSTLESAQNNGHQVFAANHFPCKLVSYMEWFLEVGNLPSLLQEPEPWRHLHQRWSARIWSARRERDGDSTMRLGNVYELRGKLGNSTDRLPWYTGGILVVYWWYTGGILVVYWWQTGGILVVYWWYTGGKLVVYWWYTGGILVANWWYTGTT